MTNQIWSFSCEDIYAKSIYIFIRLMEKTQDWGKQIEMTQELEEQSTKKVQSIRQQLSPTQPVIEQIEDDLTALRNKQNQSPLCFKIPIGANFVISYNKSQTCSFMARFFGLAFFVIGVHIFVQKIAAIPQDMKTCLIWLCIIQLGSFLLLFFLDPGTLFEDEPQKINEERLYCKSCRIYKKPKTHHCRYCLKCVRGYDHHCGFFGKCIGRRNYLLFCIFILSTGMNGGGSMGGLMYTIVKQMLL